MYHASTATRGKSSKAVRKRGGNGASFDLITDASQQSTKTVCDTADNIRIYSNIFDIRLQR